MLEKGLRWQVNSGNKVKFWKDKWIPSIKNFQAQSNRDHAEDQSVVEAFINPVSKEWDIPKLKGVVNDQEVKAIISIPLSKVGEEDRIIWHYSKNGAYSVKSGYHTARNLSQSNTIHNPSSSFHPPFIAMEIYLES